MVGILDQGHNNCAKSLVVFKSQAVACLASGNGDNTIKLWNIDEGRLIDTLKEDTKGCDSSLVVFERKESTCLVSGGSNRIIKVWKER
eukprot:13515012-Ditylum_brightwellii.AAC.1